MNDKQTFLSSFERILGKYVPPKALTAVCYLLIKDSIGLKVVPPRKTLRGSYRIPTAQQRHFITMNCDMNQYAFLITLLHEIAHAHAWLNYKTKGHQKEWKMCLKELLKQFMQMDIFPDDVQVALIQHIRNITYSSVTDINLTKILQQYDNNTTVAAKTIALHEIPQNTVFLHEGITFRKEEPLRKYIKCKNLSNNKIYRCHPLMMVRVVEKNVL